MSAEPAARQDAAVVTVRYWAGARAAAGVVEEVVEFPIMAGEARLPTVGDVLTEVSARHTGLGAVLSVCALLVDGHRVEPGDPAPVGEVLEVLPPFAGG
ncbi:MAG: MoaD/ThiS family protein [Tetrasphaera sp.]|nr:MoaD/ThiS family protein [Tetrasphaera sp.]